MEEIIDSTLAELDLLDFKDRSPFLLSGGEKKRVAIASVLCMGPDVIIADEPTQGQDEIQRANIEKILEKMHAAGKTVIVITHDLDFITRLATRVLILKDGEIFIDGTVNDVLGSRNVLEFMGFDGTVELEVKWLLGKARDMEKVLRLAQEDLIDAVVQQVIEK